VHKEQMNLVNIAEIHGINSYKVKRQQDILARSLLFRIAAVSSLSVQQSSRISGGDNQVLSTHTDVKDKIDLVFFLLTSLKSKYTPSPVKYIVLDKSYEKKGKGKGKEKGKGKGKGKGKSLPVPTIKERALHNLINLVLLPLVEMNSDSQSYGYRPYRSPLNAVSILRAQLKSNSGHENK